MILEKDAVVSVARTEVAYGFGVYENIKVRNKVVFFASDHVNRLLESAQIIGLEHPFSKNQIEDWVHLLVKTEKKDAYNLKMVLYGATKQTDCELFLFSLNPFFLKPTEYRNGVPTVTYRSQRLLPHAKTLNMLESFLAYRTAQQQNCFDALLEDPNGFVTEGTRTNLFGLTGKTIFSAPKNRILEGVTKKHLLEVAQKNGFKVEEKLFSVSDLLKMDAAFLTSTSSNLVPIRTIDGKSFSNAVPESLKKLMNAFDDFLDSYKVAQKSKAVVFSSSKQ